MFRFARFSRGFHGLSLSTPRFEFLNAAGGINKFFFAGIKRVAVTADFGLHFWFCGTYGKNMLAGAAYFGLREIFGVDGVFHIKRAHINTTFVHWQARFAFVLLGNRIFAC